MDVTAWVMMAHIVTLGTWGAALLILAGLYATSPMAEERAATHRHALMCRYVFVMLGSPAAVLAIINGSALLALRGVEGSWLLAKLAVVALLALYHSYCGHLLHQQENGPLPAMPGWKPPLLILIPVLFISTILILVLAKPHVVLEHQVSPQPAGNRYQRGAEDREVETAAGNRPEWIFKTG